MKIYEVLINNTPVELVMSHYDNIPLLIWSLNKIAAEHPETTASVEDAFKRWDKARAQLRPATVSTRLSEEFQQTQLQQEAARKETLDP